MLAARSTSVVIDAGVDHGHHHLGTARGDVPGGRRVDGGQIPELAILRIVGNGFDLIDGVLLETGNVRIGAEPVSTAPSDAPELRTNTIPANPNPRRTWNWMPPPASRLVVWATELTPPNEAVLNWTIQS